MKLIYYSPVSHGGIADYAHEQANALVDLGADVTLLTTPHYPTGRGEKYKILPTLQELKPNTPINNTILKVSRYTIITIANIKTLVQVIRQQQIRHVLFGSYSEYIAPLWTGPLRRLAHQGVVFGAVVHDPVRDFVLGPLWWHRWSIASGYSFLREAFVHEAIELDTVRSMSQLRTTVIPHGPYRFPESSLSREEIRSRLNLPIEAKVMLAFGHLRPNKNLDLVIRAMAEVSDVYLVIAGEESSSSRPLARGYQELAKELGVGDRIRWQIRFIPDGEVADFFMATDLILLTYSRNFRSASGVLNTAVQCHKLCLASGGEGCLTSVIHRHNLGIWVEPDNSKAIALGLSQWLSGSATSSANWNTYIKENSWESNAHLTLKALEH
ncbi:MAG: glycosyltransferase family 4 protein [Cyanobacteria bacterium P01_E01_bin.6]